jgi:hypothetical protein
MMRCIALGCICGWQQSYIQQHRLHCLWLYTVTDCCRGLAGSKSVALSLHFFGLGRGWRNFFWERGLKPRVIFGRNSFAYVNLRLLAPHFLIFQWRLAYPNGLANPWLLYADKCNSVFCIVTNKQTNKQRNKRINTVKSRQHSVAKAAVN